MFCEGVVKMKITIAKKELQMIRDIIYVGRQKYEYNKEVFDIGTKLTKKINNALKKVYGHTCNGDYYIRKRNENKNKKD